MRNLLILAIVLLAFHYPITTVWLLQIGADTGQANIIIKGTIIALFAASVLFTKNWERSRKSFFLFLMIFFIIYGVRLLYDVLALNIMTEYQTRTYVFGYFFGLTFLPAGAVLLSLQVSDVKKLHEWIFIALILANLSLAFYALTQGLTAETAFSARLQAQGEFEGTAIINPILVGFIGAILAAFAMGRITVVRSLGLRQHIFHAALVLLGCINILLGASRGPALAFAICFLVLLYTLIRGTMGKGGVKPHASMWVYSGILVTLLIYLISTQASFFLFDRFAAMFETRIGGGAEERDFIYALAWSDFLDHPLIGASYVVAGTWLAHNFFLDAFMATGLVGGVFFIIAIFWALRGMFRMLHGSVGPYGYSIALAAICFFVVGVTSGSIGQFPELWLFLSIVMVLGNEVDAPATGITMAAET